MCAQTREKGGAQRGVVVQRKEVARALHIGCLRSIDSSSQLSLMSHVQHTHKFYSQVDLNSYHTESLAIQSYMLQI